MNESQLWQVVEDIDAYLDGGVSGAYRDEPLAQDWARVSKTIEEAGEAIDALIGWTGQNPRKGFYATRAHLLDELADVALTGAYAIQHFTKDREETRRVILDRAEYHATRVGIEVPE
jgi:NTP pyrophosphatase (non-canonical NTP hydrolase)